MATATGVRGLSAAREDLYRLVDQLSAEGRDRAKEVLEALVQRREDPVLLRLAATAIDDEPMSPDARAAIEEGLDDVRGGRVVPWAAIRDRHLHPDR